MTITVPSAVVRRRGYAEGGTYQPVPAESLSTPTLTLTDEIGRIIRAVIGNVDPRANFYRLYLDGSNPPTTLVAEMPWYLLQAFETGDLGDGVTRYGQAVAVLGAVTALSTVQSATTDAAVPEPGDPSGFTFTANGDGTVDASWVLPDAYHDAIYLEIWGGSSWVVLLSSVAATLALDATSATNVAVPGSSGATVNGSDEFGLRIRTAQDSVNTVPSEYWAPVQQSGGSATTGTLGTSGQSVTLPVAPTNYSAMQLQYTETPGSPGSYTNVSGIDATGDFPYDISALSLDPSTAATFRLEVTPSGGGDPIYSSTVEIVTPAAVEGDTNLAAILLHHSFETGTLGNSITTISPTSSTNSTISNDRADTGSRSAKDVITVGQGTGMGWYWSSGFPTLVDGDEIWIRLKVYVPAAVTLQGNSTAGLKWFRYRQKDGSAAVKNYQDFYYQEDAAGNFVRWNVVNENATAGTPYRQHRTVSSNQDHKLNKGAFNTVELYYKLDNLASDEGGAGKCRLWVNGSFAGELAHRTLGGADWSFYQFLFITYWNATASGQTKGPRQNLTLYYDQWSCAVKRSGRDDTPYLDTDSGGRLYIGTATL